MVLIRRTVSGRTLSLLCGATQLPSCLLRIPAAQARQILTKKPMTPEDFLNSVQQPSALRGTGSAAKAVPMDSPMRGPMPMLSGRVKVKLAIKAQADNSYSAQRVDFSPSQGSVC
jgi:hypothetical protein